MRSRRVESSYAVESSFAVASSFTVESSYAKEREHFCMHRRTRGDGAAAADIFVAAPIGEDPAGFGENHGERA